MLWSNTGPSVWADNFAISWTSYGPIAGAAPAVRSNHQAAVRTLGMLQVYGQVDPD